VPLLPATLQESGTCFVSLLLLAVLLILLLWHVLLQLRLLLL
jgi:hypothetical protein